MKAAKMEGIQRRYSARLQKFKNDKKTPPTPTPFQNQPSPAKKSKLSDQKKKTPAHLPDGADSAAIVTETLRLFNKHYLHFVKEEEKRCGKVKEAEIEHTGSKSKKKVQKKEKQEHNAKKIVMKRAKKIVMKRPDLKAMSKVKESNTILKGIGSIPGIDVGHQFYSRCEMVVVGLHSYWLNGIDYIVESDENKMMFKGYTLPLAIAIVVSGQYEDDLDKCEDIIYTGQGGNDLLGNKRQIKDQELVRGNLGLKNSMEQNVPVRVVRGHKSPHSYVGKVYTYDGLYKVINYWAEQGVSGHTVYKFQLKRLEGQPSLMTEQVNFIRGRIPNSASEIHGLVCKDISKGKENFPIPVTNLVDDVQPTCFTYRKSLQVSAKVSPPTTGTVGCDCRGNCTDPERCACAKRNGSDFPYVQCHGGRLIEAKDVVYECGPNCGCGPDCVNRTSQKGLRYRLEVFRTIEKGWGVRSWDAIPSGAPVCEYIGVVKKSDDKDFSPENSYIFDIDCLQTMKGLDGRERRIGDVPLTSFLDTADKKDNGPEFCIDAGTTGNVARFINHSCQPNLFVQCVLSSHQDIKQARIVLFAADNIPPLKELTYDYGYALDSVVGRDGKIKQLACLCSAPDCRKRLY